MFFYRVPTFLGKFYTAVASVVNLLPCCCSCCACIHHGRFCFVMANASFGYLFFVTFMILSLLVGFRIRDGFFSLNKNG